MDENGLPLAFGKVAKSKVDSSRIASTKRAAPVSHLSSQPSRTRLTPRHPLQEAIALSEQSTSQQEVQLEKPRRAPESDEDDDDDDDDDGGEDWVAQRDGADLPVTHEIVMKDHAKARVAWNRSRSCADLSLARRPSRRSRWIPPVGA